MSARWLRHQPSLPFEDLKPATVSVRLSAEEIGKLDELRKLVWRGRSGWRHAEVPEPRGDVLRRLLNEAHAAAAAPAEAASSPRGSGKTSTAGGARKTARTGPRAARRQA